MRIIRILPVLQPLTGGRGFKESGRRRGAERERSGAAAGMAAGRARAESTGCVRVAVLYPVVWDLARASEPPYTAMLSLEYG